MRWFQDDVEEVVPGSKEKIEALIEMNIPRTKRQKESTLLVLFKIFNEAMP